MVPITCLGALICSWKFPIVRFLVPPVFLASSRVMTEAWYPKLLHFYFTLLLIITNLPAGLEICLFHDIMSASYVMRMLERERVESMVVLAYVVAAVLYHPIHVIMSAVGLNIKNMDQFKSSSPAVVIMTEYCWKLVLLLWTNLFIASPYLDSLAS